FSSPVPGAPRAQKPTRAPSNSVTSVYLATHMPRGEASSAVWILGGRRLRCRGDRLCRGDYGCRGRRGAIRRGRRFGERGAFVRTRGRILRPEHFVDEAVFLGLRGVEVEVGSLGVL